ncbi:DgyrCDS6989 [Dimorphilus gyrociliatus]|uniref:DgyrCDS6989 n=1 Tax=Dimorphilus gyrociliatus TaxID=2664684 RepID=A0A7I8VPQ1_9ANNE|nr:DgyrCDS6989 [Dimorphilus gyrociliatus]
MNYLLQGIKDLEGKNNMAAIKRFFEKRKIDIKFKKLGEGNKLTAEDAKLAEEVKKANVSDKKPAKSEPASRMAAQAALSRHSHPKPGSSLGTSHKSIELQVRREMEAERRSLEARSKVEERKEIKLDKPTVIEQALFTCPIIGPEILPREEILEKIKEFLYQQLGDEPQITSAMMIYTLNKNSEKVKLCVETICKYIDNIIDNPTEEKYRKIRLGNKAFQERVICIEGADTFLQSVGFETRYLPGPSGSEEEFYVIPAELAEDRDHMRSTKDVLLGAEPIKPELDRSMKIFHSSPHAHQMSIPPDFYAISPEEIKREQQRLTENAEKLGVLRTKEMRERDRIRELRRYRYICIRIRLPDGIILQGTFRAIEKMSDIVDFLKLNMACSWLPFQLLVPPKNSSLDLEGNSTLAELGLAPAALLTMKVETDLLKDLQASNQPLVRPDVMALITELKWNP